MNVATWLKDLGLERYATAFQSNAVDVELLPRLTAEDLKDLGVVLVGDRRRLLDAIADAGRDGSAGRAATSLGDPAPADGERRQVTVLFADLAGYTALAASSTPRRCTLCSSASSTASTARGEHSGHVDKHIGDCVMAVFGAPVAHDNDAERAVRAALAIRDAMPDLSQRGGPPGRVCTSASPAAGRRRGTGSATPPRVHRHRRHGEPRLAPDRRRGAGRDPDLGQGAARPRRPDRRATRSAHSRSRASPSRCGRGACAACAPAASTARRSSAGGARWRQSRAALAACRESGRGQAVHVRGEAGIGKTRLVEEFQRAAAQAGFACHAGLVLDFGAGTGRDAVRALVRSLLGLESPASRRRPSAAAARRPGRRAGAEDDAVFLNDLLDLPQPKELRALYDAMDNATRNRGKRATVARLVERASAPAAAPARGRGPPLGGPADAGAAGHAGRGGGRLPGPPGDDLAPRGRPARPGMARRGRRRPLTDDRPRAAAPAEALALAGAFLGRERRVRRALRRAGGRQPAVPRAAAAQRRGGRGRRRPGLGAEPGAGAHGPARPGRQAGPAGRLRARPALRRRRLAPPARAPGYVRRRLVGAPPGAAQRGGFLFAHALIREAVYAAPQGRRRELHRRAAAWFAARDPVLHAEHLDRAEDPAAPRAYLAAARAQAAAYRYESGAAAGGARPRARRERADASRSPASGARSCTTSARCREALARSGGARRGGGRRRAVPGPARAGGRDAGHRRSRRGVADAGAGRGGRGRAWADGRSWRASTICAAISVSRSAISRAACRSTARPGAGAGGPVAGAGGRGARRPGRRRVRPRADGERPPAIQPVRELCREHGLGRIEVANLRWSPCTRIYLDEPPALEDSRRRSGGGAGRPPPRGDGRPQRRLRTPCALWRVRGGGRASTGRALAHPRDLGARRFEATACSDEARLLDARDAGRGARAAGGGGGDQPRDRDRLHGPWILGAARGPLTPRACAGRRWRRARRILRAGAVEPQPSSGSTVRHGGVPCRRRLGRVERYAAALEEYTRSEPLPWADFFVARGRALPLAGVDDAMRR